MCFFGELLYTVFLIAEVRSNVLLFVSYLCCKGDSEFCV